jgi:hypothetical protein
MTPREKRRLRKMRELIGIDLVAGARSLESTVGFTSDKGLINRKFLTKKEKRVLDKAQDQLSEGAHLLRVLGNHLENPKHESQ